MYGGMSRLEIVGPHNKLSQTCLETSRYDLQAGMTYKQVWLTRAACVRIMFERTLLRHPINSCSVAMVTIMTDIVVYCN